MLIVVAIIAILVAVSIPIAATALERARVATDAANERAAKAEGVIMYLNSENIKNDFGTDGKAFAYDAANGTLKTSGSGIVAYGKCTQKHNAGGTAKAGPHNGNIVWVKILQNGTVQLQWGDTTTTPGSWNVNIHNAVIEGDTTT